MVRIDRKPPFAKLAPNVSFARLYRLHSMTSDALVRAPNKIGAEVSGGTGRVTAAVIAGTPEEDVVNYFGCFIEFSNWISNPMHGYRLRSAFPALEPPSRPDSCTSTAKANAIVCGVLRRYPATRANGPRFAISVHAQYGRPLQWCFYRYLPWTPSPLTYC